MQIDRNHAGQAFTTYVSAYDPTDPKIALKVQHTWRVADLCQRIAQSLGLSPADVDLAWLLGLLHDVGRFEQVRVYGTFEDGKSVSHAALGAKVLFDGYAGQPPTIRSYVDDPSGDELIRTTIELHSSWRLPQDQDERTRTFCQILRDADKIDILKVNCICSVESIYGISYQQMLESQLSPETESWFWRHSCVPRGARHFPADVLLGHICFMWEPVYPESIRAAVEQGYGFQMLERPWTRPETLAEFQRMDAHLRGWLRENGYLE